MKIEVTLFTILKKYGKDVLDDDGSFDVPEGCTLGRLAHLLGIPSRIAKVYLIDGLPKDGSYPLHEDDKVKILSFIGGG